MNRTQIGRHAPQILLTLFVFLVSACTSKADADEPTSTETDSAPTEILPSASATSTLTITPFPSTTPTILTKTEVCSPLLDHELAQIESYVSTPFADAIGSNLETGHHGLDFSYFSKDGVGPPIDGNPVQSVLNGRVAGLGFDRLPYGNMIVIETAFEILPAEITAIYDMQAGSSLYLLYAHMLEAPVLQMGDQVDCAQMIGKVGGSGFSGNPHLHLETRVGPSNLILPTMIFYDTTATLKEQEAYQDWRFAGPFELFDPLGLLTIPQDPNGD